MDLFDPDEKKMEQVSKIPQRKTVEINTEGMLFEMNRYELFLHEMISHSIKKAGMICDMDTAYVQAFTVKSQTAGTIIQVRCPESHTISVFGKYQTVSLRCFDQNNREPDPVTRMNFKKVSKHGGISRNSRATYGDLSSVNTIKYSFPDGVYLSGKEALDLEIMNPDIDIERIEFSMEADIFEMLVC